MLKWLNDFLMVTAVALFVMGSSPALAGTPMSDRVAVAAKVRAEVTKDLAVPYNPGEAQADRQCLDGRPVKDFQGDLVEYWSTLNALTAASVSRCKPNGPRRICASWCGIFRPTSMANPSKKL